MDRQKTKLINKMRLIVKLQAWKEFEKYELYFEKPFSCNHCKFVKNSFPFNDFCNNKRRQIIHINTYRWCFEWLKRGNLRDQPLDPVLCPKVHKNKNQND